MTSEQIEHSIDDVDAEIRALMLASVRVLIYDNIRSPIENIIVQGVWDHVFRAILDEVEDIEPP